MLLVRLQLRCIRIDIRTVIGLCVRLRRTASSTLAHGYPVVATSGAAGNSESPLSSLLSGILSRVVSIARANMVIGQVRFLTAASQHVRFH